MTTTEEMLELRIKETCAEMRHVQSQMNAIVVRFIEDPCAGDTKTHLQHEMLLALRHYQDTLFATIKLLRRESEHRSMRFLDKFGSMDKTVSNANEIRTPLEQEIRPVCDDSPETPNDAI